MNTETDKVNTETVESATKGTKKSLSVRYGNIFLLISFLLLFIIPLIPIPGIPLSWINLIAYVLILILAFIICKKDRVSIGAAFRLRGAKPLTFLLSIVMVFAMQPCVRLVSSLTGLLIPNGMSAVQSNISDSKLFVNLVGFVLIPA